ncbi:glycosyl hydrolase family 28-related protein [Stutzerimonas nitrititolerans]|uniref:glycosyl hydrolase family 28-related protein n=1 Tax=Stutzerimonas nitrititolerans TaxID=2482751 RepID=UPI0028AFBEDD|nr:glycosyl hydrolase family 28-related protein [Stutzerimonas nitrititolerans]
MTVQTNTNVASFNGNGVTQIFPIAFKFNNDTDLVVLLVDDDTDDDTGAASTLTLNSDYTVSGEGDEEGGLINVVVAPAVGKRLFVSRVVDILQMRDLRNQGKFFAEVHEDALDLLTMIAQQHQSDIARSLRVAETDPEPARIPPVVQRAGKLLAFDADGNPTAALPVADSSTGLRQELAAAGGSSLVGFSQGSTGAVPRTVSARLKDLVSVKDFGAKGDGVTDDTASIQAAISHARAISGATVYFPARNPSKYYKITAPLVIDGSIKLLGDGPNAVVIMAVGMAAGSYLLDLNFVAEDVAEQFEITGLTLRTDNGLPNAVRLHNASYVSMCNVVMRNVTHGVVISGTRTYSNSFDRVSGYIVSGNTLRLDGYTGGGHLTFKDCTFAGDSGFNVLANSTANNVALFSCNFEQCVTASLAVYGSVYGLSLSGCRTEGSNGNDFVITPGSGSTVTGLSITGGFFTSDSSAHFPIVLGGAGGKVRGFNISGNHVQHGGAAFVKLNGEGESGVISGNYFAPAGMLPSDLQRAGVVVFANESSSGKSKDYWGLAASGMESGSFSFIDGSVAGLAFSEASCRWSRVGRQVFWQAYVVYPATTNTAQAVLSGLPFAALGTFLGRSGGSVDGTDAGLDLGLWIGSPSATSIAIMNRQTLAAITNNQLSGKRLYLSGQYSIS